MLKIHFPVALTFLKLTNSISCIQIAIYIPIKKPLKATSSIGTFRLTFKVTTSICINIIKLSSIKVLKRILPSNFLFRKKETNLIVKKEIKINNSPGKYLQKDYKKIHHIIILPKIDIIATF